MQSGLATLEHATLVFDHRPRGLIVPVYRDEHPGEALAACLLERHPEQDVVVTLSPRARPDAVADVTAVDPEDVVQSVAQFAHAHRLVASPQPVGGHWDTPGGRTNSLRVPYETFQILRPSLRAEVVSVVAKAVLAAPDLVQHREDVEAVFGRGGGQPERALHGGQHSTLAFRGRLVIPLGSYAPAPDTTLTNPVSPVQVVRTPGHYGESGSRGTAPLFRLLYVRATKPWEVRPMKKFALLLVAALLTLVAFAQTETPTVDETIAALEGGVTSIPLDAALANIEGWQATLEASDDTAVQALGAQLGELATALQAETIDAAEVSGLLTSLGEGTVAAAAGDAQLESLGNLLMQAGSSLMGGGMSGGMTGGMTGGMSGGGM